MNTQQLEAGAKFLLHSVTHVERMSDGDLFYALLGKAVALELYPELHGGLKYWSVSLYPLYKQFDADGPTPLEALAEAIRRMQE